MDLNKWLAVGKVDGAPAINNNNGKKQAFFNFIVNRRAPQANGQWVDVPMTVPVYAYEVKADLIEKYVVDGQQLALDCHIMTWDADGGLGFGMILDNVSFGPKPRKDDQPADVTKRPAGPPM